jgi:hypothetical protein
MFFGLNAIISLSFSGDLGMFFFSTKQTSLTVIAIDQQKIINFQ